uniref:Uncharacterized protein n=1 Tax=Rhizophora mucronata TaxID=61149 RepID=A0A2P2NLI5_RHIMU
MSLLLLRLPRGKCQQHQLMARIPPPVEFWLWKRHQWGHYQLNQLTEKFHYSEKFWQIGQKREL